MAMTIPLVDLGAQYRGIQDEVDEAMRRVLSTQAFVMGPEVERFEAAFARYCDAKHALGVGNGTDALELALGAMGVQAGDEVVTVANTFVASAEAICNVGATPVFVDVNPEDSLLDIEAAARAITPRTKALLPVHLYGQPVDMDGLMALAERHGLGVVEDACQAHGARYRGRRAGSIGHAGCFSFYPGKNLGAYGDGGAVITHDDALAAKIRRLRDHGRVEKYRHDFIGRNSRLDGLQAAVLDVKLGHLDRWNAARRSRADLYRRLLSGIPGVVLPAARPEVEHVWHLFVIQVPGRDQVVKALQDDGIGVGVHYPIPLNLQPAFERLAGGANFPVAERLADSIMSLPLFPELTDEQIGHIVARLEAAVAGVLRPAEAEVANVG